MPRFGRETLESEYWDNHSLTEHLISFRIARNLRFKSPPPASRLSVAGISDVLILEGGLTYCRWLEKGKGGVWAMERQVRMGAGLLVTTGLALAWAFHPAFSLLSLGVGLGLIYSAASDTCGMAMVLARMPWNRRPSR